MSQPFHLHGTRFSYFSAKARAYLNLKRIPYVEDLDQADFFTRIIPVIHRSMIPVVETPEGEILQDTTDIIDILETRFPDEPILPDDPLLMTLCRALEHWSDEFMLPPAMHYRWQYPESKEFILKEFARSMGNAEQVADKMQSYLPFLGLTDEAATDLLVDYFQSTARALDAHFAQTPFVFGDRPCHADLCVFEAYFAHEYRDRGPASDFLRGETHHLSAWIDKINSGNGCPTEGELYITDDIKAFLQLIAPSLTAFAQGIVAGTDAAISDNNPGDEISEQIPPFTFDILGKPFTRGGACYAAWKIQRIGEAYADIPGSEKETADAVLSDLGLTDLCQIKPDWRLEKRDYNIWLA